MICRDGTPKVADFIEDDHRVTCHLAWKDKHGIASAALPMLSSCGHAYWLETALISLFPTGMSSCRQSRLDALSALKACVASWGLTTIDSQLAAIWRGLRNVLLSQPDTEEGRLRPISKQRKSSSQKCILSLHQYCGWLEPLCDCMLNVGLQEHFKAFCCYGQSS